MGKESVDRDAKAGDRETQLGASWTKLWWGGLAMEQVKMGKCIRVL